MAKLPGQTNGESAQSLTAEDVVFDHDLYNAVAQSARLRTVSLIGFDYTIKPSAFELDQSYWENGRKFLSGKMLDIEISLTEDLMIGQYQWAANIKKKTTSTLKVKSIYLLAYEGVAECDPPHLQLYLKKIGRFTTYPYFRALFSTVTGASGLTLPPLPTITDRVD